MIERIIVLGGKGGVGKSSISAATAVILSDLLPNKKILLLSFDIAHNLSDLFNSKIGDNLTKITDNLWAIEPDPDKYAQEYTEEFVKKLRKLIKKMPIVGLIPQIKTFIDTTFTTDSIPLALKNAMFFQKLLDAEDVNSQGVQFDIIVADFPPTGNMVALFEIPEDQVKVVLKYSLNFYNSIRSTLQGVTKIVQKMTHPFEVGDDKTHVADEIVKMLNELEQRGERISNLIHKVGSLRLVTIAEKPSFEEIKRARDMTQRYIDIGAVHINMITPETDTCDFCQKNRSNQLKYINDISNEFRSIRIWQSNRLKEEPIGIEGLRRLAREVYGNSNINEILYPKK